mgnify:CR=1 FL=1
MNISANWRRVIQVKPYETETVELGLTGSFQMAEELANGQIPPTMAKVAAQKAALLAEELHRALTLIGDRLVVELIVALRAPPSPAEFYSGAPSAEGLPDGPPF